MIPLELLGHVKLPVVVEVTRQAERAEREDRLRALGVGEPRRGALPVPNEQNPGVSALHLLTGKASADGIALAAARVALTPRWRSLAPYVGLDTGESSRVS